MYKLITFDANGTLLKLRYPVGHIYSVVGKRFGIESDTSKLEDGFKQSWVSMNKQHPNFGLSSIGWRNWWKNIVFQSFIKTHKGNAYLESNLEPVANKLIDIFSSDEGWDVADGCIEILDDLRSKQIKIGVISNFDPRLHTVLKSLNIYDNFCFVLTSYEAKVLKPDKKIFNEAKNVSQINSEIDQDKCILHVGDNVEVDYVGAVNAGWDAVVVSEKKEKLVTSFQSLDPEKTFHNLFECKNYINSLF